MTMKHCTGPAAMSPSCARSGSTRAGCCRLSQRRACGSATSAAPALARACRAHGLVIRRAQLREIAGDGVAVGVGDHLVRLRGRPVGAAAAPPPLIVEVDGAEVAGVRFVRNGRLEAAAVVRRLQRDGLQIFLASERVAAGLAAGLGADRCGENISAADKIRLLRDLRRQSAVTAYVGDCVENAPAADEAHLSIYLAGADGAEIRASDIVLLTQSIAALPALRALARDGARRMGRVRNAVMLPNLLCVAGAFALGFTPMAAVLLSNFGHERSLRRCQAGASRDAGVAARPSLGLGRGAGIGPAVNPADREGVA